ncbi:MAG: hypothetical protein FJW35_10425, partial [Acidobacteria bacterium]|nr:hypothetical protein [Acidobacteriota bacterium]
MRPTLRLLDNGLIEKIIDEARDILCRLGVEIHNPPLLRLLGDHGAEITAGRPHLRLTQDLIDRALRTVPRAFKLYDVLGNETHDFSAGNVYFTPGSA